MHIITSITGRNGGICCIRVVMVKMPLGASIASLPAHPADLPLQTYAQVHQEDGWGAYLAEVIIVLIVFEGFPLRLGFPQ